MHMRDARRSGEDRRHRRPSLIAPQAHLLSSSGLRDRLPCALRIASPVSSIRPGVFLSTSFWGVGLQASGQSLSLHSQLMQHPEESYDRDSRGVPIDPRPGATASYAAESSPGPCQIDIATLHSTATEIIVEAFLTQPHVQHPRVHVKAAFAAAATDVQLLTPAPAEWSGAVCADDGLQAQLRHSARPAGVAGGLSHPFLCRWSARGRVMVFAPR
ncbi:hypothetical protein BDK51DRAFT_45805 [Blyttiomyces helicus]|uniref:Uncharacterized protein n=1 Tax=Blyttiomyces helicus TaxID=388810 RepID=A0A4P9WPX7_9FUNG|nr:hypothetical protein BDK51DRAFT_45805 [Blyttiomyces helicus]|eukprot:RKO92886.1 hypothetical protein BDK51DRAFT_45805 [Blyttiomyces helicus]